jgi:putative FmdB family regulatory protein
MPTYDYVCEACGHEFEHFQSMSDPRLGKCPKCGKKKLVRKVGAGGGVIFKGSGFYETDYKRAAPTGSKSSSTAESASNASSSDAAGSGKPACAATPGTCAADAKPAADTASPSSKPSSGSKKAAKK